MVSDSRSRFEAWVAEHPGDFDLEIQEQRRS